MSWITGLIEFFALQFFGILLFPIVILGGLIIACLVWIPVAYVCNWLEGKHDIWGDPPQKVK